MKNETTKNEAIVATDLTKSFGEGEARVTAVNRVGLVAHFGEMLFIVGPSGSGKTTLSEAMLFEAGLITREQRGKWAYYRVEQAALDTLATALRGVICQRMVTAVDGKLTPALEILLNTPMVRKLLEENRLDKLSAAIETGNDDGMLTFNQSLFNLVKAGRVTEKEALAKATNPQALEMNFKGIFLNEGGRIVG